MTDETNNDDRVTKDRSPSFPFIPLKKAVERARQFATAHKRNPARLPMVAETWGYGMKSSGLLQTAAALKGFGLLEDIGRGEDRKVTLTELAWKILTDERPGAREQALKTAAVRPRMIAEYLGSWGTSRPADAHCLSELRLDRGFTDAAATLFLRVYDETLSYANLREDDSLSINLTEQVASDLENRRSQNENESLNQPNKLRFYGAGDPLPGKVFYGGPSVPRATLPLTEGIAALELPTNLSPRSVKALRAWIDVMIGLSEESGTIESSPSPTLDEVSRKTNLLWDTVAAKREGQT